MNTPVLVLIILMMASLPGMVCISEMQGRKTGLNGVHLVFSAYHVTFFSVTIYFHG